MAFTARLRNLSRRKLWTALGISVAVNVSVAVYTVAYLPIMRLGPLCIDYSDRVGRTFVELDGEMTRDFFELYLRGISGRHHRVEGTRIYVTLASWLDHDFVSNASYRATYYLLAERTGANVSDVANQRLGLPRFDEVRSIAWPPCEAVRELALKGGEWASKGPVPDPEVLKRRAERGLR
jgi:hypothetical protein